MSAITAESVDRAAPRRQYGSMSRDRRWALRWSYFFLVLFAIFFWTFLWGLFGTFIGVPITLAILTFCAAHPSSRWVADLFGGPDQMKPGKR